MTQSHELRALHTAVSCYLAAIQGIGTCLAEACPPLGAQFQHRLGRLRTRLALDLSPEALEETRKTLDADLADFAREATKYLHRKASAPAAAPSAAEAPKVTIENPGDDREAAGGAGHLSLRFASRQEYYAGRLREVASRIERAGESADRGEFREKTSRQAAALLSCVESMHSEYRSVVELFEQRVDSLERRLNAREGRGGITSREDLERLLSESEPEGSSVILVRFEIAGSPPEDVIRQVGDRLVHGFRSRDVVARWSHGTYLVLFSGSAQDALFRSRQVQTSACGIYRSDSGVTQEVIVEASLAGRNELGLVSRAEASAT